MISMLACVGYHVDIMLRGKGKGNTTLTVVPRSRVGRPCVSGR
jgi:hypothetical protein